MKMSLQQDIVDRMDPSTRAVNEKRTVLIERMGEQRGLGSWHFVAEKGGYGSMISIPLVSSTDAPALGVMTIYTRRPNGFDPKEKAMLEELAGDIGFAYESFVQKERLHYHLTTDGATNLPNRFSLVEALTHNDVCALALINIDRFSDINEVYGNGIGDAILSGYGHWLSTKVAPIGENAELFKLGGDEYALIFKNCLDLSQCVSFLEKLITATQKESFMVDDVEIVLTISVGISPASDRMLEHANAALKQAKRNRHSLEMFSFSSKEEQENNIAWYKRIKEAIEESRIVPYFQPIVDNHTKQIVKYEALIRLIERDGTVVSPYLFLEIAKKTKLYPELTKIMVQKVVETFKYRNIPVSLNLSTQDLITPELADFLENMICSYSMGQYIIFEILESEGIGNYTEVSRFVDRFKAIGCRFAIDDFGSGYSSLSYLKNLMVDELKIDKQFVDAIHTAQGITVMDSIIRIGRAFGLRITAEGIETPEQWHQLRMLGCDVGQGFLMQRPVPIDQAATVPSPFQPPYS
jgi:diguanylate cyclase (GGDEF)-like protein